MYEKELQMDIDGAEKPIVRQKQEPQVNKPNGEWWNNTNTPRGQPFPIQSHYLRKVGSKHSFWTTRNMAKTPDSQELMKDMVAFAERCQDEMIRGKLHEYDYLDKPFIVCTDRLYVGFSIRQLTRDQFYDYWFPVLVFNTANQLPDEGEEYDPNQLMISANIILRSDKELADRHELLGLYNVAVTNLERNELLLSPLKVLLKRNQKFLDDRYVLPKSRMRKAPMTNASIPTSEEATHTPKGSRRSSRRLASANLETPQIEDSIKELDNTASASRSSKSSSNKEVPCCSKSLKTSEMFTSTLETPSSKGQKDGRQSLAGSKKVKRSADLLCMEDVEMEKLAEMEGKGTQKHKSKDSMSKPKLATPTVIASTRVSRRKRKNLPTELPDQEVPKSVLRVEANLDSPAEKDNPTRLVVDPDEDMLDGEEELPDLENMRLSYKKPQTSITASVTPDIVPSRTTRSARSGTRTSTDVERRASRRTKAKYPTNRSDTESPAGNQSNSSHLPEMPTPGRTQSSKSDLERQAVMRLKKLQSFPVDIIRARYNQMKATLVDVVKETIPSHFIQAWKKCSAEVRTDIKKSKICKIYSWEQRKTIYDLITSDPELRPPAGLDEEGFTQYCLLPEMLVRLHAYEFVLPYDEARKEMRNLSAFHMHQFDSEDDGEEGRYDGVGEGKQTEKEDFT